MILCDIGNTSYHFLYENGSQKKYLLEDFDPTDISQRVFFISVNSTVSSKLSKLSNWIDLEPYIKRSKYYETMGTDRIFAVEAVTNGVVVDAGSAITVDVVKDGVFQGGFIYPGIRAMHQCYKNISDALDYSFNFELDLGKMAKNSQDAISYGYLKPFHDEVVSYGLDIILTGGDAKEMQKLFKNAKIVDDLIFQGMKKIIKKADIC